MAGTGSRTKPPDLMRTTCWTSSSSRRLSQNRITTASRCRAPLSTGSPCGQLAEQKRKRPSFARASLRHRLPMRKVLRTCPSEGNGERGERSPRSLLKEENKLYPIEKVLSRLEDYTERRDEFRARCPAHNGTSANSLSVKEGDDRRALLICHAGCELQEICSALGISVVDLFVHNKSENGTTKKVTNKAARNTEGEGGEEDSTLTTHDLPEGTYWEFTSPSGEVLYI